MIQAAQDNRNALTLFLLKFIPLIVHLITVSCCQEPRRREKSADTQERMYAGVPRSTHVSEKMKTPARSFLLNPDALDYSKSLHPAALPPIFNSRHSAPPQARTPRSTSAAPQFGARERSPALSNFRELSPRPPQSDLARREGSVPLPAARTFNSPSSPRPDRTAMSPRASVNRQQPALGSVSPRTTPAPASRENRAFSNPPSGKRGWLQVLKACLTSHLPS
jgi:hypothetical protein